MRICISGNNNSLMYGIQVALHMELHYYDHENLVILLMEQHHIVTSQYVIQYNSF